MSRLLPAYLTAALLLLLATPLWAQDALTLKALARIEQYEKLEPSLKQGDVKTANLYLNQIGWAAKRLGAVSDQNEATWKDAKKRYDALKAKIEKKARGDAPAPSGGFDYAKLVQLNKEVANAIGNFKILSLKHLQDQYRVKGIRKELADFEARLAGFPADDDNVKIVTGNVAGFRKLFEDSMKQVGEGKAAKGGMETQLAQMRAKYESRNTPDRLSSPFEEQQLRAWALEMRRWRDKEIPADLEILRQVAKNPTVDQNPVDSLYYWLDGTWRRRLDEIEKWVRERVASDVFTGQETAKFILETDPAKREHVLSRILSKGRFDQNMLSLQEARHAIAMARIYDEAMGSPAVPGPTITDPAAPRPAQPDRDAQEQRIEAAIKHLKQIVRQALNEVRMPPAASTDKALLKIAAETLRNPDYEIAGWERLVIDVDKRPLLRREAWLKPGSSYLTLSYYEYAWDEFQVTTAEKVDGEVWLFANTLKLYSSGDPTTPIGRWILSRRYRLTPILSQNVGK
jgi:hypothetical protein